MRFGQSLIAAAALFAVGTTAAQANESRTFKHEGVTYTYRVIEKGDKKIIVGKTNELGQGQRFSLMVKNGKVSGNFRGQSVAFVVDDTRAQTVVLASD